MQKWHALLFVGGLLSQLALVGCQPTTPAVSSLPEPSFDAPKLAAAQPPAPFSRLKRRRRRYRASQGTGRDSARIASSGAVPLGGPTVAPRAWKGFVASSATNRRAVAFGQNAPPKVG